jgi:hypothetical protein
MKKHPALIALLSSICILFAFGCASKGTQSVAKEAAWRAELNEDLEKKPPKWSNTGDEDVDAFGTKLFRLVDGSYENMQQVNTKLAEEIPYNVFMNTLAEKQQENPDLTEEQLLQEMRDEGRGDEADKVVSGRDAIRNRVTEASNFLEKTFTAPEIVEIAVRVESLKAKLDSADFLMKAKLGKAFINLTQGAAYVVHCRNVTRKLNASITAQNKDAKKASN